MATAWTTKQNSDLLLTKKNQPWRGHCCAIEYLFHTFLILDACQVHVKYGGNEGVFEVGTLGKSRKKNITWLYEIHLGGAELHHTYTHHKCRISAEFGYACEEVLYSSERNIAMRKSPTSWRGQEELREAPPPKKTCKFGHRPKGGGGRNACPNCLWQFFSEYKPLLSHLIFIIFHQYLPWFQSEYHLRIIFDLSHCQNIHSQSQNLCLKNLSNMPALAPELSKMICSVSPNVDQPHSMVCKTTLEETYNSKFISISNNRSATALHAWSAKFSWNPITHGFGGLSSGAECTMV